MAYSGVRAAFVAETRTKGSLYGRRVAGGTNLGLCPLAHPWFDPGTCKPSASNRRLAAFVPYALPRMRLVPG